MQTAMSDHQFDTTHSPVCWSWGSRHYECALREIERLRAEVEHVRAVLREQRQRDEVLLQQALDVLERGMLNTMLGRGVAAAIRERLHDKLSTYREVAAPLSPRLNWRETSPNLIAKPNAENAALRTQVEMTR